MCISKYHYRGTNLLQLNQAVSRQNKHLVSLSKGDDGSSSGSDDDSDDEPAFDNKGTRPMRPGMCGISLAALVGYVV